jgi:hypothetical protein
MIEQARTIGLRVLFSQSVLIGLYYWTQQPDSGASLWRRFAKNIQDGFDGKRILIADQMLLCLRSTRRSGVRR